MKLQKNIRKTITTVLGTLLFLTTIPATAQSDIDTLMKVSENAIDKVIKYKSKDSVAMDLTSRKAYLFGDGSIDYDSMLLNAERIVVDFDQQTLQAHGITDTAKNIVGRPFFKQGGSEYHADTITFNYSTKKGIINGVITQEGEGFLHGHKVKKINDSVMYLSGGSYTTCNYAHPHFTPLRLLPHYAYPPVRSTHPFLRMDELSRILPQRWRLLLCHQ